MARRFCTNCGAEISGDSKFCTSCGAPVPGDAADAFSQGSVAQQPEPVVPSREGKTPAKKRLGTGAIIGIVAGIVIAVAALGTGALVLSGALTLTGPWEQSEVTKEGVSSQDVGDDKTEPQNKGTQGAKPEAKEPEVPSPEKLAEPEGTPDPEPAEEAEPVSTDPHGDTLAAVQGAQTGPELSVSNVTGTDGTEVVFGTVEASSSHAPEDGLTYDPSNLTDGDLTTSWQEGQSGSGVGSYLMFSNAPDGTQVSRLLIAPGYHKTGLIYDNNARPKEITIIADGQVVGTATLADEFGQYQEVALSEPVSARVLAVRIDSVYPGVYYEDCAISELWWR